MATAATHCTIIFDNNNTIDVQETLQQMVPTPVPQTLGDPARQIIRPIQWVTLADGTVIWINVSHIIRIIPK